MEQVSEAPYVDAFDQEVEGSLAVFKTMDEYGDASRGCKVAGRKLLEEAALDMSLVAADGIGITLLMIWDSGVYGGGLQSKALDKIARILVEANSGKVAGNVP